MNAVRQILKVENHRVTVQLPADFAAEEVEVIVLPAKTPGVAALDSEKPRPGKLNPRHSRDENDPLLTELQRLILEAPAMSDEEYELIMEKRRALH
jgi:hypothetical protein